MLLRYDVIEFLQIDGNKLTLRVKETGFAFKWDCWNPFTESKNPPPKELYGHWITDKGYRSKAVRFHNKIMAFNTFAQRIYNEQKEKKQHSEASSKAKGSIAAAAAVRVRKANMISGIIERSAENQKKQRRKLEAALSETVGKMGNANSNSNKNTNSNTNNNANGNINTNNNNDADADADASHPYGSLLIMATTTTTTTAGKMHGSSVRATTTTNTAKKTAPTPEEARSGSSTPPLDIEEEILAAVLSKIHGANEKEQSNSSAAAPNNRKRSSYPRPDHHVSQTQPKATGSTRSSSFDSESSGTRPKRNDHRQRNYSSEPMTKEAATEQRRERKESPEPTPAEAMATTTHSEGAENQQGRATQRRSSPTLRSESPDGPENFAAARAAPVTTSPTPAPAPTAAAPQESPKRFRVSLPDGLEPTHFEELATQRRLDKANADANANANANAKGQPRHKKYRATEDPMILSQREKSDGLVIKNRLLVQQLEISCKRNTNIKNLENEVRTLKQEQRHTAQQQKLVGDEYQNQINGLCHRVEHFRNLCQEQSKQVQKLENLVDKLTSLNKMQEGNYKKDTRVKKQQIDLLLNEKTRLENRFRALMTNQNCFRF